MKHKMVIKWETLFNIASAATTFYKEYQKKMPEIFDEQDKKELEMARKLKKFCIDTSALRITIKDRD